MQTSFFDVSAVPLQLAMKTNCANSHAVQLRHLKNVGSQKSGLVYFGPPCGCEVRGRKITVNTTLVF